MPPAIAGPSTAAISGLVSRKPLSSDLITDGSNSPDSKRSEGEDVDIAARSAPAQNAPPAPVRMHTRTSASSFTRSQASAMISSISPESAFFFSGRFMVTTSVWPTSSTRACGAVAAPVSGAVLMGGSLAKNKNVF